MSGQARNVLLAAGMNTFIRNRIASGRNQHVSKGLRAEICLLLEHERTATKAERTTSAPAFDTEHAR